MRAVSSVACQVGVITSRSPIGMGSNWDCVRRTQSWSATKRISTIDGAGRPISSAAASSTDCASTDASISAASTVRRQPGTSSGPAAGMPGSP